MKNTNSQINNHQRIQTILQYGKTPLHKIPQYSEEYLEKAQKNCENIIGTVSVPVGVAGPLYIHGKYFQGKTVLPLATTEGCLVASVNRGCKAILQANGCSVEAKRIGITRAPVFLCTTDEQKQSFCEFIKKNIPLFQEETKKTSRFVELLRIDIHTVNNYVFVKCFFDSKDAMGMNGATIACQHLIQNIITPQTGIHCIALSGNICSDKKPAHINKKDGRGFYVHANVNISQKILTETLKCTPENLMSVYESKIVCGSKLAESLGANAHHANMVSALFLATGQDIAQVVEGSLGDTKVSKWQDGVNISVDLPAIVCGTVGGGTHLPKQQEALQLMGITVDPNNPGVSNIQFAEIIGGAVLAGEISLLSALASSTLSQSHKQFCR